MNCTVDGERLSYLRVVCSNSISNTTVDTNSNARTQTVIYTITKTTTTEQQQEAVEEEQQQQQRKQ